jgi:tetratricopeptide (TPR) repeat protein
MNLTKALELNPRERKYKARLIEIYLYSGRFNNALRQIDRYRKEYPDSELPYRHLGGYYMFQGDSATAVKYYMEAIELGTRPEVGKLLYKYFSDKGDTAQASYYLQKAFEAEVNWNPNQY